MIERQAANRINKYRVNFTTGLSDHMSKLSADYYDIIDVNRFRLNGLSYRSHLWLFFSSLVLGEWTFENRLALKILVFTNNRLNE
ncbi:hypothetical protein CEXT_204231 [Caerostris extrusa]|uniref:Uncharacterized protein n=1 Tax=Caerostris extrusa TaxID=172846 RepID=A0AAV4USM3_CAEEX|nr:hypothetical protein CEXT_204231 [Caerostris extrusa]